jgi:hypothetical protein
MGVRTALSVYTSPVACGGVMGHTNRRPPIPIQVPTKESQNSPKPLPLHHQISVHSWNVNGTYRLARKGTLRSVNVFAHNINVKQNDKNTMPTKAKNEIWIGQVVKILYSISIIEVQQTHPLTEFTNSRSLTSRSRFTINSPIASYTSRCTPSTNAPTTNGCFTQMSLVLKTMSWRRGGWGEKSGIFPWRRRGNRPRGLRSNRRHLVRLVGSRRWRHVLKALSCQLTRL